MNQLIEVPVLLAIGFGVAAFVFKKNPKVQAAIVNAGAAAAPAVTAVTGAVSTEVKKL